MSDEISSNRILIDRRENTGEFRRRFEDRILEDHDRLIKATTELEHLTTAFSKYTHETETRLEHVEKMSAENNQRVKLLLTIVKTLAVVNAGYIISAMFEIPIPVMIKAVIKALF